MNIFQIIKDHLDAGNGGTLATVIARTGSAPRDVGAKMFVTGDGSSYGTIGGGALEHEVLKEAVAGKDRETAVYFSYEDGREGDRGRRDDLRRERGCHA